MGRTADMINHQLAACTLGLVMASLVAELASELKKERNKTRRKELKKEIDRLAKLTQTRELLDEASTNSRYLEMLRKFTGQSNSASSG